MYKCMSNWLARVALTLTATLVQVFKGRERMEQGDDVGSVR